MNPKPTRTPTTGTRGEWMRQALCATGLHDPEMWTSDHQADQDAAAAICQHCPVIAACLAYGIATDATNGIYGGTTAETRAKIVRNGAA